MLPIQDILVYADGVPYPIFGYSISAFLFTLFTDIIQANVSVVYNLCLILQSFLKVSKATNYFCKFTELSKIGFSLECLTADCWQFFRVTVLTWDFGWVGWLGTCHQLQSFLGFS